ncbi:RsmB/NOP family class I SAM-dependent RNA methyltransferase [Pseudoalteromonas obscura]|uniref:RsmB/NOP family class I SAM-dependent RNA methyltransferase n=1 Tax=Pseudoalteromonas obscura TaxID=3048491 RepID=A0ABT7EM98_9GAMM|nr:RsmB/NOP family class I SAM-dependent RNA methyltransferase [Pseudoalteromonas sp. P94(2023)]MDK2596147.1 RsmB/NOP family class I SAM-dependent RNA methyltransferase [Pseudoalteromonas sp. P94(2023)]
MQWCKTGKQATIRALYYKMRITVTASRQLLECLNSAFLQASTLEQYADKVVQQHLMINAAWTIEQRAYFVTTLYNMVRFSRKLCWAIGRSDLMDSLSQLSVADVWNIWGAYTLLNEQSLPDFPEVSTLNLADVQSALSSAPQDVLLSMPSWLHERANDELGDIWPTVATALNQSAEHFIRVNSLKSDALSLTKSLAKEQIKAVPVDGLHNALKVEQMGYLFRTDAFQQGHFEMQDAGSQQLATLLDVQPGMKVVDACAGSGGKSLHIAALLENKGRVLSLDIHQHKLDTLKKRAKRAGSHVIETRLIQNSKTIKRQKEKFDRVLLDVPCSGTGILRRNPDAKWHLTEKNIENLVALQQDILQRYSQMCRVGGKLVYATCSILPSENACQVERFLANNPNWRLEKELSLMPGVSSAFDGFYGALLVKNDNS